MKLRLSTSPILDTWFIPDVIAMMPKVAEQGGEVRKAYAIDLELVGRCPSKKNKLRHAVGGTRGLAYKKGIKSALEALFTQARAQYGPRLRLSHHPNIEVWIQVDTVYQDKDGILTSIIDVMKKAAVIEDDSIKVFNGVWIIYAATIGEPHVRIRLNWRDADVDH